MKFKKYYIENSEGKSNCVVRSFCKILNKKYNDVFNELCEIKKELSCDNYNDIIVFETYMKNHDINMIDYGKEIKVCDLKLEDGTYIVFCYDKKDFYHMLPIINNTIYDKEESSLNLYTISLYKKLK